MTVGCILAGVPTSRRRAAVAAATLMAVASGCRDRPILAAPSGDDMTVRGAISVSPELTLDPPVIGGTRLAGSPAVAFDGQSFLVVYNDMQGISSTVSAARVSPAGAVLDRPGTIIGSGATVSRAVAFGGGGYLVAWQDYQNHVLIRRVGSDGQPLGNVTALWANDPSQEYDPSVAFDGTNFVVSFRTSRGQIVASRVGTNGALIDATPKVIVDVPTSSGDSPAGPRLAFDGANYQLLWRANSAGWSVSGSPRT
jgi:hypothetical protein